MSKRLARLYLILGACLSLSAGTFTAGAQMPMVEPPAAVERSTPEQDLKRLTKALKLTDQQKAQILPVLKERSDAISRVFADQDAPMRDKLPKILEITDRSNTTIRVLLTEPQQKKFDRMVAEEKKQREMGQEDEPTPDMPPPPPQ